uniref:Uncharacterized protein n=1 Tax=Anguilla anguilla TaxID=7936 RepID=A0A0E9WKF4_ANGAN
MLLAMHIIYRITEFYIQYCIYIHVGVQEVLLFVTTIVGENPVQNELYFCDGGYMEFMWHMILVQKMQSNFGNQKYIKMM